jgi:outer membrane protein TolC
MKPITAVFAVVVICASLVFLCEAFSDDAASGTKELSLDDFIIRAVKNDTVFETVLIDELALRYQKDLTLPAGDFVLSVRGEYDVLLSRDDREETGASVSLGKLFPYTGTDISAEYQTSPYYASEENSSQISLTVSQPIARNAFGRGTRLLDKIVGLEVEVARHQIIEAYEDYLAQIFTAYYDWYEAYENLKIAEASYKENLKLQDNIEQRRKSKIALPVDVNKITILVLAKKENLITYREAYENALNIIETAIRYDGDGDLVPKKPPLYASADILFEEDFADFKQNSRTYKILRKLEEKSSLKVAKDADDLLPSIDAFFEYEAEGDMLDLRRRDDMISAGFSVEWPFPDQVERAEYQISKINRKKTKLSTENTHYLLYSNIKNLYLAIEREKNLLAAAEEKVKLAASVLEAESENYTYGKITLNDYINAVNALDTNRFNAASREAQLDRLIIEKLRITDWLVTRSGVKERHGQYVK